MTGKLMAGVLAVALWGGAALADDDNQNTGTQSPAAPMSENPEMLRGSTIQDNQAGAVVQPPERETNINIATEPTPPPPRVVVVKPSDNPDHVRGASVSAVGGVEGYSGALAPQLRAGPAWGVNVSLRPTKVFGIDLDYSGATNELSGFGGVGAVPGADVVRNGGRAMVTLGLTAARVQPYLMGGVGFDHYDVHATDVPFHGSNTGSIPVGAGVRTFIRGFTADARFGYNVLFNNEFADEVVGRTIAGVNSINAGRYQGTLSIGGNF